MARWKSKHEVPIQKAMTAMTNPRGGMGDPVGQKDVRPPHLSIPNVRRQGFHNPPNRQRNPIRIRFRQSFLLGTIPAAW
jgi:hypothetical protein